MDVGESSARLDHSSPEQAGIAHVDGTRAAVRMLVLASIDRQIPEGLVAAVAGIRRSGLDGDGTVLEDDVGGVVRQFVVGDLAGRAIDDQLAENGLVLRGVVQTDIRLPSQGYGAGVGVDGGVLEVNIRIS